MYKQVFQKKKFQRLIILLTVLALCLGFLMVLIEKDTNPKMQTPLDGIYWAVTTVTTVGYGDVVPITPVGRLLAVFLQLLGAGVFGAIVAMFSMSMNRNQDEFNWQRTQERFERIEKMLEQIDKKTNFMVTKEDERK